MLRGKKKCFLHDTLVNSLLDQITAVRHVKVVLCDSTALWAQMSVLTNVKIFFKAVSDKPPSIFTYFYYKEFFDQVLDHRWLRTGNLYPCIFFSLFYLRRRLFLSFKVIVLCPESVMIYLRKKKFTLLREVLFPRGAASSTLTTSGF